MHTEIAALDAHLAKTSEGSAEGTVLVVEITVTVKLARTEVSAKTAPEHGNYARTGGRMKPGPYRQHHRIFFYTHCGFS